MYPLSLFLSSLMPTDLIATKVATGTYFVSRLDLELDVQRCRQAPETVHRPARCKSVPHGVDAAAMSISLRAALSGLAKGVGPRRISFWRSIYHINN
jgi:hypothetical protein